MLVNWQKILKYNDININDENIFYILSYFFDDFIFESFDKDGNILAITKKTGKKVKINVNNTTYNYMYDEEYKDHKSSKKGTFELLKRFYTNEDEKEVAFLVRTNKEDRSIFPNRRDYELTKENVRYSYDEYEGDIYAEVIGHANKFYIFPHKKKVPLKPDVSVGVVIEGFNDEKKLCKRRLLEDTLYNHDLIQMNVITPIAKMAHDTVSTMFKDDDNYLNTTRDVYNHRKIGF